MKKLKYMCALLVCASVANAVLVTPSSVTFTGTAVEFYDDETHIIDESGLSESPTLANLPQITHSGGADNTWVTDAPGGGLADYYVANSDATVVFEFDLGATFNNINTFVSWPYGGNGNDISEAILYFSTDGGATTNSSQTVSVDLMSGGLPAIVDITPVAANFIIMALTDNHFEDAVGGDRAGVGEIRFVDSYDPAPSILSFYATPSTVVNGGTATLFWNTTYADTVMLDQGIGDVTGLTSNQVVITGETTYTLTATNSVGITNASVTVFVQEAMTGTIIQPTSITGNLEGDAGSSIADLTSGSGLSTPLVNGTDLATAQTTTHVLTGTGHVDSWTISGIATLPVFSMDLGSEQALDAAVLWQYGNNGGPGQWDSGNHTRQFELIFHTTAEGSTFDFDTEAAEFSGTMAYIDAGGADSTDSNTAQIFQFAIETAQYVGLRIVSNWGGEDIDGNVIGGGDRFGLGEVRFVTGSSYVADPIGNIMITGPVAITGGQGMVLSWSSSNGQEYDVQYKNNLIIDSDWTTFTNVTGTGGEITVTTAVDNAETFYQVETPAP